MPPGLEPLHELLPITLIETDVTVEIVAEGPKDKLEELIEFCKKGPEAAEVSKVDVKFEEAKGEFDGFEIRY